MKIEEGNLEDFSLKFAVKFRPIHKPLKFSDLQNLQKIADFVKIFHKNPASKTGGFLGVATRPQGVVKKYGVRAQEHLTDVKIKKSDIF